MATLPCSLPIVHLMSLSWDITAALKVWNPPFSRLVYITLRPWTSCYPLPPGCWMHHQRIFPNDTLPSHISPTDPRCVVSLFWLRIIQAVYCRGFHKFIRKYTWQWKVYGAHQASLYCPSRLLSFKAQYLCLLHDWSDEQQTSAGEVQTHGKDFEKQIRAWWVPEKVLEMLDALKALIVKLFPRFTSECEGRPANQRTLILWC